MGMKITDREQVDRGDESTKNKKIKDKKIFLLC